MQISNFISSEVVVNRVYSTGGFQTVLPYTDMIQYIFEVLSKLGQPLQYIPKTLGWKQDTSYEFSNYKIQLPCDFYKLTAIAVNGCIAVPATNDFHALMDGKCCGVDSLPVAALTVYRDNFGNEFSPTPNPVSGYGKIAYQAPSFTMNSNFITFGQKEGKVCLSYLGFPIDNNGFPLVPDDEKYLEAITRYIIYKLDYINWRTGVITKEVYEESKREYEWYIGQAANGAKLPDVQQMEGLKNQLVRLKPNHQQYSTYFQNLQNNVGHRNI